jgi:hypothetical protein
MTSFVAAGSAFTTLDASLFVGSLGLHTLEFSAGVLASVVNLNQAWTQLSSINFFNNKINVLGVDKVFNDYVTGAATIPSSGTFHTDGQSPAAPPSSVSLTARNTLIADSWTLITD